MVRVLGVLLGGVGAIGLARWYGREQTREADATVHLQSEHEHFHLHVDLPSDMVVQPGDTVEILSLPPVEGETHGEISYASRVRLHKASWLKRNLIKRSSMLEINELVEHP